MQLQQLSRPCLHTSTTKMTHVVRQLVPVTVGSAKLPLLPLLLGKVAGIEHTTALSRNSAPLLLLMT
jgi:hypothetical protein